MHHTREDREDREDREMTKPKTTTTAVSIVNPSETAARIAGMLRDGIRAAADEYTKYIANGGQLSDLIATNALPAEVWRTIDGIATGTIVPELAFATHAAARRIRLLPPTLQREVIANGVDLLRGSDDVQRVRWDSLSQEEAEIAFGADAVRDAGAQRAYIETRRAKTDQAKARLAGTHAQFDILPKRGAVRINEPCMLTRATLLAILQGLA